MSYPYELALWAERNRNQLYDAVVEALEKAGISQSEIARATGRKPSQISVWLSGPSNWTADTSSDLLRSVRATMEYRVVFDDEREKEADQSIPSAPKLPDEITSLLKPPPNTDIYLIDLTSSPRPKDEGSASSIMPLAVE